MQLSILLTLLLPLLVSAWAPPKTLPTTCDIGKICAWGWGDIYTIYEAQPNLTTHREYQTGETFEVSQDVGRDANCQDERKPHNRIYTVSTLSFSGLGSGGCTLDFNIPCNSSVPFYHRGNAIVAAHFLPYVPSNPTWNNIVPLINPTVLGTFGGSGNEPWKRDTFEQFTGNVCGTGPNGTNINGGALSFVFTIDESVHESAGAKWNQTLMNADIVVGYYVNFTC